MAAPKLVTPEAVVLDLPTADVATRIGARVIDVVIQIVAGMLLGFALLGAGGAGAPSTALWIILLFGLFLIVFAYPAVCEWLWKGRTVGKLALGLRVLTTDGAPIRFRQAAVRSFMNVVDVIGLGLGPVIGIVAIFLSSSNQRLGDVVAGTIVVRERSGAGAPAPVHFPMPNGCEAYASTIDVAGIGSNDYVAVRSFLLRAPTLPPHVRSGLATELAVQIAARARHTPPSWVYPELFLAVVAAKVQQRSGPVPAPVPTAWGSPPPPVPAVPIPAAPAAPAWGAPAPTPPAQQPPAAADDGFALPR